MCGYSTFLCNTPSKIKLRVELLQHLGLSLCLSVFWLLVNCSLSTGGFWTKCRNKPGQIRKTCFASKKINLKSGFWKVSKHIFRRNSRLNSPTNLFFSTLTILHRHHHKLPPFFVREEALNQIDYKGSLINIALDASWHFVSPNKRRIPWGPDVFGKHDLTHDYV